MENKTFYLTTTLPYVNANLHIGHAAEFIRADILARYKKAIGYEVFFNTGADEHGQKILATAQIQGKQPQEFVDQVVKNFQQQLLLMNIGYAGFTRTTDPKHIKAVQEFWKKCEANGDIYKKKYQVKYCVGCELEKTDSELVAGCCPLHPDKSLEIIEEENYFFRFSRYGEKLLQLYENNPNLVVPDFRLREIKKFVKKGLQDFSISRLKEKMSWGVPVPNDETQVMYVWFDALVNYISAIGWPDDQEKFEKWWPVVQVCGKDNLRQQTAMWQAMLLSAGLTPSRQIFVFGFINSGGQKMSKSLGNVINPLDIIKEYGTDALRYYIARHLNMYEDSDLTMEKFREAYNANLANGLGNLVSRVMKMVENYGIDYDSSPLEKMSFGVETTTFEQLRKYLNNFEVNKAIELIWEQIALSDKIIQEKEPFKLIKEKPEEAWGVLRDLVQRLIHLSVMLTPFMPETAEKIQILIKTNKSPKQPLFLRK